MKALLIIFFSLIIYCSYAQISFFKNAGLDYYKVRPGDGFQHPNNDYHIAWNISNGMSWNYRIAHYDSTGYFLSEDYISFSFYNISIQDFKLINNEYYYLKGSGNKLSDGSYSSFSYLVDKMKNQIFSFDDTFFFEKLIPVDDSTLIGIGISKHINDSFTQYVESLTSIDIKGNIEWTYPIKKISDSLKIEHLILRDISLNNFLIYCYLVDKNNSKNIFLKFSMQGELLEIKIPNNYYNAYSIEKSNNGIFLFSSQRNIDSSQYVIHKLSDEFTEEWKLSGPEASKSQIRDHEIDKNGVLNLIIYHSNNNTFNAKGFSEILKVDSLGSVLEKYQYYIEDNWLDFHCFNITNDNGYLILCTYEDFYPYFSYLIKTDSNGYVKSDLVKYISSGDETKKPTKNLQIYPNPCTTNCTFKLPNNPNQKATLNLYSITGKLIRQEKFTGNSYEFNRGDLSSGLYLYKIISGKNVFTGKLIVSD